MVDSQEGFAMCLVGLAGNHLLLAPPLCQILNLGLYGQQLEQQLDFLKEAIAHEAADLGEELSSTHIDNVSPEITTKNNLQKSTVPFFCQ